MNTRSARHMETTPRLEDLIFDKVPVPKIASALGVSLSTAYRRRRLMPGYQHKSEILKRCLTKLSTEGKSPAEMAEATGYKEVWIKMRLLEWGLRPKVKEKGATVDPDMIDAFVGLGMSPNEIRTALGCSKSTLYRRLGASPVYKARMHIRRMHMEIMAAEGAVVRKQIQERKGTSCPGT